MISFIDIHSHSENNEYQTIVNCFPNEIEAFLEKSHNHISIGLHPWHIFSDYKKKINTIRKYSKHNQVIAIGETGLDKSCQTDFSIQKEVFLSHAQLAELVQKPLIIHCVKAYTELIQLKKDTQAKMPWILHGYRGNKNITSQLLENDFYFSLGKGIDLLSESITLIPLEKVFLETDDSNLKIDEVYKNIARIRNQDLHTLIKKIADNYMQVFSRK
jgi:TatD DNase family protein